MLNSLFRKKNTCFVCKAATTMFICSSCRRKLDFYQYLRGRSSYRNFDLNFTAPYYRGFKELIWNLKFGKDTGLAKGMAYLMLESYLKYNEDIPDLIGYVPMGPLKEKQRGFNQSRILAEELGRLLNRRTVEALKRVDRKSLYKAGGCPRESLVRGTMSQLFTDRSKHILFIDDVHTTGSTAREVLRAIGRDGFRKTEFLFFARQEKKENLTSWFS